MKKIREVSFSWDSGRYFDLWMIVHALSGVVLGFFFAYLLVPRFWAYLSALAILVLWEIFESLIKVPETKENRVVDVVIGFIGFVFAFGILSRPTIFLETKFSLLIFAIIVLAILSLMGWLDYTRRHR